MYTPKTRVNCHKIYNSLVLDSSVKEASENAKPDAGDNDRQLAACRAEIARLEDLNNEKDKTLATMRIQVMAADDTPQQKSNQKSPELNNLIMQNQPKIERVLLAVEQLRLDFRNME
ncbi:Hypothetical predicted protein [Mytilus galloprovincialis]|uniref:Uncharacterized protein n=1 Tax=Mytilus galloprovincialis TaxID=29158 RepID=A0A8B6H461_MYTGA|nr:Hypothetical predicted protein [Mytilus galloprovincialis]